MRPILLNLSLAFIWVGLTGEFTAANFLFGLLLSFFMMLLFQRTLFQETTYFEKVVQAVRFLMFFLWELTIANIRVAYEVLTPSLSAHPSIVDIPLSLKSELQITLLANLITLTPGTLSLEVSDDKKTLYVHSMYAGSDIEGFRRDIKNGFEKRIKELFE